LKNGRRHGLFEGDDLFDSVGVAFDFILEERAKLSGCELLIEEKVDCSFIDPELTGSLDVALVQPFGLLHVMDYKHGAGISVDPVKNTQLLIYAIGIAEKYGWDFEDVRLTIIQPRARDCGGIKHWDLSIDELKAWVPIFDKGIKRTKALNAKPFAGDWCKYCRASVDCPALGKKSLAEAKIEFTDIDKPAKLPDISKMTPEQLGKVLDVSKVIEIWLSDVRAFAEDKLKNGGEVKGWGLVPKRSYRVWKDPKKAASVFGLIVKDAFVTDLKSPAQMEKEKDVHGKKDIKKLVAEHTTTVSNGVTLGKTEKILEF